MHRTASALAGVLLAAALAAACGTTDSPSVTEPGLTGVSTSPAHVTQHCPDGGVKTEVKDGFTSTNRTFRFRVASVCVKAGTAIHLADYDGIFGGRCYKVQGLGTYKVKLAETGYKRCKDVSYYVVYPKKKKY